MFDDRHTAMMPQKEEAMQLSHPFCENTDCRTCYNEHSYLGAYLGERCGTGTKVDHLGKIHKWMSDTGRVAETEFGWAHPDTFRDEVIDEYVRWYLEE